MTPTTRRSRRRTGLSGAALLGVASLVLAGCSGSSGAEGADKPTGQTIVVSLIAPPPTEDAANEYLKETFEAEFPGNKLVFDNRTWADRLSVYDKTVVAGEGTVPDVIELGNTDAPAYTAQGVLTDLTSRYQELGGSDFLPGFVTSGSYDGKFYAPPFYAGARLVYFDGTDKSVTAPTSLDEFVTEGIAKTSDDHSGIYLPGRDWHDGMAFVLEYGGFIAEQEDDGSWRAGFASLGGLEGLTELQQIYAKANSTKVAPTTSDEGDSRNNKAYCKGDVTFLLADMTVGPQLQSTDGDAVDAGTACPKTYAKTLKAIAMPGRTPGTAAKTFAGGSNLAIPAKSTHQELAYEVLKIMTSPAYQDVLAVSGMIPGRISSADHLPQDSTTLEAAKVALNAIPTPASPNWYKVEASQDGKPSILAAAFQKIAQGKDVDTVAEALDKQIEDILNAKS